MGGCALGTTLGGLGFLLPLVNMSLIDGLLFDLYSSPFESRPEAVFSPSFAPADAYYTEKLRELREREARRRERREQAEEERVRAEQAQVEQQQRAQLVEAVSSLLNEDVVLSATVPSVGELDHTENANKLLSFLSGTDAQYIVQSEGELQYTVYTVDNSKRKWVACTERKALKEFVFDDFFVSTEDSRLWSVTAPEDVDANNIVYKLFNVVGVAEPAASTDRRKKEAKLPEMTGPYEIATGLRLMLPVKIERKRGLTTTFGGNLFRQALVAAKGVAWYSSVLESTLELLERTVQYIRTTE